MIAKRDYVRLIFVGMAMGTAYVIPGLSGGTIAVVFGIYERLMNTISTYLRDKDKRKENTVFLSLLFFGNILGVIIVAKIISYTFIHYPLITVYFFMGLILGSIPVVVRSHKDMKLNLARFLFLIFGIIAVIVFTLMRQDSGQVEQVTLTSFTFYEYLYFIFCGMIAASAMIIPGISGSFMLILLGIYWIVLESISGFSSLIITSGFSDQVLVRLYVIATLGIGILVGILVFSKIMSWALKNYPANTMYLILGLILGSFYQMYPGFEPTLNGFLAILSLVLGTVLTIRFSKT